MKLKKDLLGKTIYIKRLDKNVLVSEVNIPLLKSVQADVFEEEVKEESEEPRKHTFPKHKKQNDNNQ